MTSVRQDLEEALRQYEEEERKRKEEELRKREERISQTAQHDVESMYEPYLDDDESCYMNFNGTNLGLVKDGILYDNLDAIHGGLTKGSRGCIDIPYQTDKLWSYLDGCEEDEVPLYVKYKRKHW